MLKEAPTTWDQVVAIDKELAAHGKKAILWDYNKSFFTWPLLAGSGGTIFAKKPDGSLDTDSVGVNAPGAVQAATMLQGLIKQRRAAQGRGLLRDGRRVQPRRDRDDDLGPLGLGQRQEEPHRLRRRADPRRSTAMSPSPSSACSAA